MLYYGDERDWAQQGKGVAAGGRGEAFVFSKLCLQ